MHQNKCIINTILASGLRPNKTIFSKYDKGVIIYGAGKTGREVLALLQQHNIKVDCFLDQNAESIALIDHVPVVSPDNPYVEKTKMVILALFNDTDNIETVINDLTQIGYDRIMPYTELFLHFADSLATNFWLGPNDNYKSYANELALVLNMLGDARSKELYLAVMRFRMTGNPAYLPEPERKTIYFPIDLPTEARPHHFIDCGAFEGDTLLSARDRFGMLKSVRAFEPDPKNFQKLVELNDENPFAEDIALIPCGVWDTSCQLNFNAHGTAASNICDCGHTVVQCLAIDQYLGDYRPTFIKLDIEGSELEALNGCKKMIQRWKPDLAVSIYHRPEHLWAVPLFIREQAPGYRYFLRLHGHNGFDTVLYAIYDEESRV